MDFRMLQKDESQKFLDLMQECFQGRKFRLDWFEWLTIDCPFGDTRTYIAVDGEKFIASYQMLPLRAKINNQIYHSTLGMNLMTHPDYRKQGIAGRLFDYLFEQEVKHGSIINFGHPNNISYKFHVNKGPLQYSNLVFIGKHEYRRQPFKSIEVDKFSDDVNILIEQVARDVNFMIFKNARFLNWRYSRPDQRYKQFIYKNANEIKGYLVLKHYKDQYETKTHICDILAMDNDVFDDLIFAAEHYAKDTAILNCWQIEHSIYEQAFARNGYVETSKAKPLMARTITGKDIVPNPSRWWFALGDNDVY